MTAPPPYGRSPRVPGPREVVQTYFLVGNNNLHPHLLYILLLPTRTGNGVRSMSGGVWWCLMHVWWCPVVSMYIDRFEFIDVHGQISLPLMLLKC